MSGRANSRSLRRKPLRDPTETTSLLGENRTEDSLVDPLQRHLSLFDLTVIGVGATIGSGLFVLCGFVAKNYAGPATALSWALSGLAACTSGCCYAELAARIPAAGSTYAYAYVSMGELPALLAAGCLSVEYIMTSAAVARSWGGKLIHYLVHIWNLHSVSGLGPVHLLGFSPLAFCIGTACILLLLAGVKDSKAVTNVVTVTKVVVVFYMVIGGFFLLQTSNWTPFIPPQYGMAGVFRGATASFFGYIGYDEVACLAGEAKNPKRNLPFAIMGTLVFVTIVYTISALSLTGMQPYQQISAISGFPAAFSFNNAMVSSQITALGELCTLPVVVLLIVMAQPRLQYALAEDGLVPQWFGVQNEEGNLRNGTLFAGTIMVLFATFVPFAHLNDMISSSVLSALSLTDTSLILLWYDSPAENEFLADQLMLAYHTACLVFGVALTHFGETLIGMLSTIVAAIVMVVCVGGLCIRCPRNTVFGGLNRHSKDVLVSEEGFFRTPWVPYLPCFGIFINWYLIAQLHLVGILGTLLFLGVTCLYYYAYAIHHSVTR